jgi:hypothetical protein
MTVTWIIILIIAVIVVAAVVGYVLQQRRRSQRLRSRFGPEYERAVHEQGSAANAERALLAREKRMEKVHIRSLSPAEHDRFADQWREVQARFVDDPAGSIRAADRLVYDVMLARGYPMGDFEHRAEDISVDHPHVVRNYRSAHEIALSEKEGKASTEDLRQGLVYYRDLFDELIEVHAVEGREVRR